jgi:hypothetical protein
MKKKLRITLGLLLMLSLHAEPGVEDLGASAASELKKNLMGALKQELARGNIAGAIEVCATKALPLTAKSGEIDPSILTVHRRTDRWRNPANQADQLDAEAMQRFREDTTLQALTLSESEQVARYYQPLRIMPMCLACHGDPDTFAQEVTSALQISYADDRATGYEEGELRGVIQVRIQKGTDEE